ETLDLALDIEADLGIDSIKRVEILGRLREDFPGLKVLSDSADVMDALTQARTLGAIVDRMAALVRPRETAPSAPARLSPSAAAGAIPGAVNGQIGPDPRALRRVLEVVDAPLPRHRLGLMAGGRVLITEDGRGVAEIVAGRLAAAGVPAERMGGSVQPVEWTSPSAIEAFVARLRERG